MPQIHKIVLTGGPCAGKTSALAKIREHFQSHGFHVFVVPETATLLLANGCSPIKDVWSLQAGILRTQLALEHTFLEIAKQYDGRCLIIYDRGACDAQAFVEEDIWTETIKDFGTTHASLMARYDGVVFMESIACAYKELYTLENNAARQETAAQAILADKKVCNAWTGHPHFKFVQAYKSFDLKMERTINIISQMIGIPTPIEIEKKYLVKSACLNSVDFYISHITQNYLISSVEGEVERVRRTRSLLTNVFTHTTKKYQAPGVNIEVERNISAKEYYRYLERKDPNRKEIDKNRYFFLWKNQYFEMDVFPEPIDDESGSTTILEIELTTQQQIVELPPFLEIIREVTEEPKFTNYELAKR